MKNMITSWLHTAKQRHFKSLKQTCFFALLLATALTGNAGDAAELRRSLLLYSSFDTGLNAEVAKGDKKLYQGPGGNRKAAVEGLPEGVQHAPTEGRPGKALHFQKKIPSVVFYRGDQNMGYNTNNWSGAVSLWMRLDPDKDLEPGYCDPLQFVAQAWGEGNMFIEFSKDHTPRHFRYAILPITRFWNPNNRGWEDIPEKERPMVPVHRPPFSREKWTHVVFAFGNINSGKKDGWGKLYLDGQYQGEFTGYEAPFNWDISQAAITLGVSYVGWLDDLAVFNRPLTEAEVKLLHSKPALLQ